MNLLRFEQGDDQIYDSDLSEHFSIEEETEELLNEVFNQKYEPVYNPLSTKIREEQYKKLKKETNQLYHHKKGEGCRIYQNFDDEASPSFNQFLMREQERVDKRNNWLTKQRSKKEETEVKALKKKPEILRGSRQTLIPIYQRCIGLQKDKQKQLEIKRNDKFRKEVNEAESFSYHPNINASSKQRTFEQYFTEKEIWKKEKQEEVQRQRVAQEVKKLTQCTFAPTLIAKYNKPNPRIVPGERVEQRLLRSLQRSLDKAN